MTRWTRAGYTCRCGGCGAVLRVGMPLHEVQIVGVTRTLYRCEACAGQAPPDLPPLVTRESGGGGFTKPMVPVKRLALRDWKTLQAGDRGV